MKELRTEIEIQAAPERVWEVLTDIAHYPEWNPFIYRAEGQVEPGGHVKIYFRLDGGRETTLACTVIKLDPCRELCWKWQIVAAAIYGGEHRFVLEPLGTDRVRFVDAEVFSGLLLPLFAGQIDTGTRRGFEAMDRALKARTEGTQEH